MRRLIQLKSAVKEIPVQIIRAYLKQWLIAFGIILAIIIAIIMFRPSAAPEFQLTPTTFDKLPGWQQDNLKTGLSAFLYSCQAQLRRNPNISLGPEGYAGTLADWQPLCKAAKKLDPEDTQAIREFFQTQFVPVEVKSNGQIKGKFTGYYEAMVRGSLTQHDNYQVPVYTLPDDLITVNLGAFRTKLRGERIVGRKKGSRLIPYHNRQAINDGELKGRGLEVMWVDNKVDRFFLEIQGSGRAVLDNGQVVRLLYAGKNGAPYVTIGKVMLNKGYLSRKNVSMQSIRDWLNTHPDQAQSILNTNPSFVFFKVSDKTDIYGAENVPLTPGRSLAVDKRYIPLGLPLWLNTDIPSLNNRGKPTTMQRLMISQDTGGMIKGAIRGDVFWGFGGQAEFLAGHMNHAGRYWVLLPKAVVDNGLPDLDELQYAQ